MPYGWLTEMGKGVQDDMRAVQPMKNLRVNRAILAEEDRIARENAARRMAELEAPPQSSMPMLTQQEDLAPVAMPEAPKAMPYVMGRGGQAEANAAWNSLAFQQQKELETLRARAEANEDITDEFNKTAARHQGERAQATQQYGDASPETKAGIQELLGTFGQDKTGKIAVRGRRPYNTILTAPTQGYIAQSLAQDPSAGYRGQMILLDEMNAARARATPRLQGSEGLDEYGKQIEATSSGLNQMITQAGLNERANLTSATQIEKTRMQGLASEYAVDARAKDAELDRSIKRAALKLKQGQLDEKERDSFVKNIENSKFAAREKARTIMQTAKSMGGVTYDSMLRTQVPTDNNMREAWMAERNREIYADNLISMVRSKNDQQFLLAAEAFQHISSGDRGIQNWNRPEQTEPGTFPWSTDEVLQPGFVTPAYAPGSPASANTTDARVKALEEQIKELTSKRKKGPKPKKIEL
jgi:hypothetical protein